MLVTCWRVGSGGLWVALTPAEYLRREAAGEVTGVGVEAAIAHGRR